MYVRLWRPQHSYFYMLRIYYYLLPSLQLIILKHTTTTTCTIGRRVDIQVRALTGPARGSHDGGAVALAVEASQRGRRRLLFVFGTAIAHRPRKLVRRLWWWWWWIMQAQWWSKSAEQAKQRRLFFQELVSCSCRNI